MVSRKNSGRRGMACATNATCSDGPAGVVGSIQNKFLKPQKFFLQIGANQKMYILMKTRTARRSKLCQSPDRIPCPSSNSNTTCKNIFHAWKKAPEPTSLRWAFEASKFFLKNQKNPMGHFGKVKPKMNDQWAAISTDKVYERFMRFTL
jgi:hypothetical protein